MNEFNLIDKYFVGKQNQRKDVLLPIGDDCAVVKAPDNAAIAISTDTLVAGTHFLADADPALVAHKALASNLSDLAAMGATPAWVSLALTLPDVNPSWLDAFTESFYELADYFSVQLIGGDTTKGPLSMTLTVQGFVPEQQPLTRRGAKVGDWIYVTGCLGDSKAGLEVILDSSKRSKSCARELEKKHYLTMPRILVGQALLPIASSAVDISDGLIADLSHILKGSNVGAQLDVDLLPVSKELTSYLADSELAKQYALSSGEEYELCFTVSEEHRGSLESALAHCGTTFTCIGQIRAGDKLELHSQGKAIDWQLDGFDHFEDNTL
ncbi:thiamine-phosphate kinase [Vibrio sp. S4M6]|uniref:thiamine-phosphate kinase n=1 Tax=Vibrio sinus TaxID=2946865 RepID=UPI002029DBA4|nr:thiamine-phosphate kinase [Vibrio sinus]MCL9782179.1 thiamine-phosphate kinase [Vibrio sinus]